jgi:hypothetical protein
MQTAGNYMEIPEKEDLFRLKITLKELLSVWKRCGVTADYGARYLSCAVKQEKQLENSASTILNELIENAAKYSASGAESVELRISSEKDRIIFQVDNTSDAEHFYAFRDFVMELTSGVDVQEMYLKKLQSIGAKDDGSSGIGLMTIISYYGLKISCRFQDTGKHEKYRISVQAAVPVNG